MNPLLVLLVQYTERAGYALREFYARNPRLAPKPASRGKRTVVCVLLAVMVAGTAACLYLRSDGVRTAGLPASVQHLLPGHAP
jgi:hypothetical protein